MGRKDKFDKFYTKIEVVDLCLSTINLTEYKTIIEPSAGNGSFSNKIKNCIAFDISPEHENIIKQDFLSLNKVYNKPLLFIGNPPFGMQNNMIIKFFKKCEELGATTIAFILPKSFKKHSLQDKIPNHYHLKTYIDLPINSFLLDNNDYDVPCIFQVWTYKNEIREKSTKLFPTLFKFVKKNENPDFSFRRVGVNAGVVDIKYLNKSEQSHYFIKGDITLFQNIKWHFDNTVGPKSISKQELIQKIEKNNKLDIFD